MRYGLLFSVLCPLAVQAANVNGYAQVTAIAATVLTIGTSDETGASFTAGKDIVIMQMQDNVIGTNTGNNANFGNLNNIQKAGNYVVRTISSVTRVLGSVTVITLTSSVGTSFNIGTNCSVQAITFEYLGYNYTLSTAISPLAWNGSIGGVVAVRAAGKLTLAASITADGTGFRGGARDRFNYTSPCNTTDYYWSSTAANTDYFASKGEGIYKNTSTAIADGRGKMINAGGGANQINAGGGGGGNYTAGGSAVKGWSCSGDAGGIGGIALSGYVSASRVFMGGGGGGGEGNDDVSTDGANGGGIILIKTDQLATTGTCAGIRISADGGSASTSGNDGAGAGGAGGTVLLQVPTYSFAAGCPLVIRANGGQGGDVGDAGTHGGGGGGGQGAVIFSTAAPTTNVTVQTLSGRGGYNESGHTTTAAGSGGGASNAGVITAAVGPLPIELLSFQAIPVDARVDLRWSTASERDNAYFTVERSIDTTDWQPVATMPGAGNSQQQIDYALSDAHPLPGTSYYRLKQTDIDGTSTWSAIVPVYFADEAAQVMGLFPNPARERVTVLQGALGAASDLRLCDAVGREVPVSIVRGIGRADIDLSGLMPGPYLVLLRVGDRSFAQRLLVEH